MDQIFFSNIGEHGSAYFTTESSASSCGQPVLRIETANAGTVDLGPADLLEVGEDNLAVVGDLVVVWHNSPDRSEEERAVARAFLRSAPDYMAMLQDGQTRR